MERKSLFKVTIYNEDRTSIHFIANNKIDATGKYQKWIHDHFYRGLYDEDQDFELVFVDYVYE